jgi:hypothetical protein
VIAVSLGTVLALVFGPGVFWLGVAIAVGGPAVARLA